MDAWQSILIALGGNAALVAVLGFLAKSFVTNLLGKDFKRFESDLQARSSEAVERLRAELRAAGLEHEVWFTRLHEKRADLIAELYQLLVEAMWKTETFVSPMEWVGDPPKKEQYVSALSAVTDVYRYFDKNRIYLPTDLCKSLDVFLHELRRLSTEVGVWARSDHLPPDRQEEKWQAWETAWQHIKQEMPKKREELEDALRQLLAPRS